MNEEELSLKVQKNWVRIKHETQHILERLMDKLLEDGAVSLEDMKEIKSNSKEDQFDFLLYKLIECRNCKMFLRILEIYGRRPLCVAIRKTELGTDDFNTPTHAKLRDIKQNPDDLHLKSLTNNIKDFHEEIGETVRNMTQHMGDLGQRMEQLDAKVTKMTVEKKPVKKKSKVGVKLERNDSQKLKDDSDRLKRLVKAKSDEVVKRDAQLQAKTEEIKWLRHQLGDKDSSKKKLEELLRKSDDEKLTLKKRLYDSKRDQLDLSNQFMANDTKTNKLTEKLRTLEIQEHDSSKDAYGGLGKVGLEVKYQDHKDKKENGFTEKKIKRVSFKDGNSDMTVPDPKLQGLKISLDNALEEKTCINKLLKFKSAETLKLTMYLRTKSEDKEALVRQSRENDSVSHHNDDLIRKAEIEIIKTRETLEFHMKEIEDLTDKLKPVTRKIEEITEQLKELERG